MQPLRNPLSIGLLLLLAMLTTACDQPMESPLASTKTVAVHVEIDASTIASDDPMAVIDPVWWRGNIYDGPEAYEGSLGSFAKAQRFVWAILWYDAEVNNGGHDQFYGNSTGIVWRDALSGFEAIGAPEAAAILRESADRLGGSPSLDREEREQKLEELAPDFSDLDDRYYALEKTVDVHAKMMAYIRSRPGDFMFSGSVEKPAPTDPTLH